MWIRDARYLLRQLVRAPTSSLTVVCTIGLAIAANTLVFTVLEAALLRKLPYKDEGQLVVAAPLAPGVFLNWRSESTSFASLSAFLVWDVDVRGVERAERVLAAVVTPDFFVTLGAAPQVGRVFTTADWRAGSLVAIASATYARRRFGGDASALRQTLSVNGRRYEIVGVMPAAVRFPALVDLWIPARQQAPEYPLDPNADVTTNFGSHYLGALGRLDSRATPESCQAEQRAIFRRLVSEYPKYMVAEDVDVELVPIRRWLVGELSQQVLILVAVVAVVLLIACTNVANVLLVRVVGRSREFATRTALGATSLQVVRPLLIEVIVLGFAGGIVGLIATRAAIPAVVALSPNHLNDVMPTVDALTAAFALLLSLGAACVAALAVVAYALQIVQQPSIRTDRLVGHSRGAAMRRRLLVTAQCGACVTLLVLAVLLVRSFEALRRVDPGFDAQGVYTAQLVLPAQRYSSGGPQRQFFERVLEHLSTVSGARDVAAAARLPFVDGDSVRGLTLDRPFPGITPEGGIRVISPAYFNVLHQPLRRGRPLNEHDTAAALPVAIVNETFERRYWPGESAIGHRFRIASGGPWLTVVGVVGDVKHASLREQFAPEFYVSYLQMPWSFMTIVVRSDKPLAAIAKDIADAVSAVDSLLPLPPVRPLGDLIAESMGMEAFETVGLAVFAGMALLLAIIGLYGVLSYGVNQRMREFGVRVALGAAPRDLARAVFAETCGIVSWGVLCGSITALFSARVIRASLFGIGAADPLTFELVITTVVVIAFAASLAPAVRAMRVDPVRAISAE